MITMSRVTSNCEEAALTWASIHIPRIMTAVPRVPR